MKKNEEFIEAICMWDFEKVKLYIEKGIDVNFIDEDGKSPLYNAIYSKAPVELCKLLIQEGANVNFTFKEEINVWSQIIYYADEETRSSNERDGLAKELIKSGRLIPQNDSYYEKMGKEIVLDLLSTVVEIVGYVDKFLDEDI